MALIQTTLRDGLLSLFASPPSTAVGCAGQWAQIMATYTLPITPPSTTVVAAALALESALVPIFTTYGSVTTTATDLENAWKAFAVTVGAGMAPAWAATPPPGNIGFLGLAQASPKPATHLIAANNFSLAIHSWMLTGTATAGPSTVNWS